MATKYIQSIIFTFLTINLAAQSHPVKDIQTSFVSIIVTDLERSINWYSEVLEYETVNTFISEERGIGQANLKNGKNTLELIQLKSALDPGRHIEGYSSRTKLIGLFKVGFTVSDFDRWLAHFKEHNVRLSGDVVKDPVSGLRMIILLDPDGNRVQIFTAQ